MTIPGLRDRVELALHEHTDSWPDWLRDRLVDAALEVLRRHQEADTVIPLDELRRLFAGVWIYDSGDWETAPCYDVGLAFEVARRCDTVEDRELRRILYGDLPADEVPAEARTAIALAAQRYRALRTVGG